MNKKLLLLIFISIISIGAYAQNQYTRSSVSYGIHPGTVTTLDGQVIKGYIFNFDNQHSQKECIYYTDYNDGRSKKTYKPSEIAGYSIENDQYKSIPYSGNIPFGKPDNHFVYVAQPGAITTYVYYAPEIQLVWQKGGDAPIGNGSMLLGFKKNILKLVGDDIELAGKITRGDKGYGITSLTEIVNEYDTWVQSTVK